MRPSLHAADLELTRAIISSPPITDKREEPLSTSSLDDDTFFCHYAKHKSKEKANKNEPFPLKLYRILHEAKKNNDDNIISFCPDGRSFMIHDSGKFVEKLMPKYFTSSRMTSFQRQLNLYGFRRRLRGDSKGGFFNDSFREGQRNLCLTIKRKVQNFKIPPHLLSGPSPSPVAKPSPVMSETGPGQMVMLGTPVFSRELRVVTSDIKSRVEETPRIQASPLLRGHAMMQSLPSLPSLGSGMSVTSLNLISQPPNSTAELLKLTQQLRLAKEEAAIKQQVALAAIQRLARVNRIEVP